MGAQAEAEPRTPRGCRARLKSRAKDRPPLRGGNRPKGGCAPASPPNPERMKRSKLWGERSRREKSPGLRRAAKPRPHTGSGDQGHPIPSLPSFAPVRRRANPQPTGRAAQARPGSARPGQGADRCTGAVLPGRLPPANTGGGHVQHLRRRPTDRWSKGDGRVRKVRRRHG